MVKFRAQIVFQHFCDIFALAGLNPQPDIAAAFFYSLQILIHLNLLELDG
jgi:hypothetical protein